VLSIVFILKTADTAKVSNSVVIGNLEILNVRGQFKYYPDFLITIY